MAVTPSAETPVMRQYLEVKERYSDCIVFFRLGDFYEMFYEDAVYASQVLDLTLTSRDRNKENPIPMCGVPYHSSKQYITKLLEKGKKIAICEQVEDPKLTKKIVRRAVTQVITPGVVLEEDQLQAKQGNYLATFAVGTGPHLGYAAIAYVDISTGEFMTTYVSETVAMEEIFRIQPSELLWVSFPTSHGDLFSSEERIKQQFRSKMTIPLGKSVAGSKEEDLTLLKEVVGEDVSSIHPVSIAAAAACIRYIQATQLSGSLPLYRLRVYEPSEELFIDDTTRRHLELFQTSTDQKLQGSLLWVLDRTCTALGGRLLRKWLSAPSQQMSVIQKRQDAVDFLVKKQRVRDQIRDELVHVHDIERLASRLALEAATPRDLVRLGQSLKNLPRMKQALSSDMDSSIGTVAETKKLIPELLEFGMDLAQDLADDIEKAMVSDPPTNVKEGGIFKRGYHAELDELVELATGGKNHILALEERERNRTGISSLKIQYNRVFGYYIEITRTHLHKVPADYIRKQTLAQAERFITPELSEYEAKVLGAEDKRLQLEEELFLTLRKKFLPHTKRLFLLAAKVAEIDTIASLAEVAHRFGYVRPEMSEGMNLVIEDGRHPVVEQLLQSGQFVPNDIRLHPEQEQICLITGPNMAGKSTMMRQVALICILGQMGSFVPAKKAQLGLIDRVFTRVGASDNLSGGDSTFMVEMKETAQILKQASRRSLVVLDEIGRGTSTFDGISIAWAVAEYLHDIVGCKTLFATHYHELCALSNTHPRVYNMSVAVKQWEGDIIFLHKLVAGGASRSYGIEVAKLAGLPHAVLQRARAVLSSLESGASQNQELPTHLLEERATPKSQLAVALPVGLQSSHEIEILERMRKLNCDELTPKQAFLFLMEWVEQLRN